MSVLRVFLLCVMVVALPVQGFAAASQSLCHQLESETSKPASAHAHQHDHDQVAAKSIAQQSPDQSPAGVDHACSNCAHCCFGLSLAAGDVVTPPIAAAPSVQVAASQLLHSDATPGGLERPPPRLFL